MRLRQAIFSSTLQQNATLFVFFGTGVVIAHLITPRQAGSYAVAIAAVGAIADLKDSAVGSYIVSAPEVDNALMRAAFGMSLTIAACLIIGLFGLSFLLADLYQDPALGQIMRIVAVAQLGPAAAFPATMYLTRAMRFGSLLIIGLAAAICQSLTSIGLAARGYGGAALAWGYLVSAVMTAAMTIAYKPDAICLRPTLAGSRRLLAFGGWASGTLVVGSAAMSAPELMIGRVLGLANAALFSRAQNLVSFVRNGLVLGIARPLLPGLGKRKGAGESLAPIYQRIVETITGLAWPIYAVLAIWAEPLVRAIYGDAWTATGTMMAPIAVAHALTLTVGPHYDILIVKRRQRLLFLSELGVSCFTLMALAIGMTHGIRGALWSMVLSGAFFAACNFAVLRSVVAFPPGALLKAWSRSLALTLVAIPAPLALRHLVADGPIEIIFGFATSGAISAIFWIATAMLVRHELSFHLSGLLNDVLLSLRIAFTGFRPQPKETDQA